MQSLHELEAWLKTHLPEVAEDLSPGATDEELQSFATALEIELPDDFVQLYRWHNGQDLVTNAGPWYGLNFMPLDDVQTECEQWRETWFNPDPEFLSRLDSQSESTPPGFVKKQYANPKWIPFANDWGGNYLGIDLDPDEKGTYGQVINFGRDEMRKIAVAPSIGAFVDWMLSELRKGNFKIEEEDGGERDFNTLNPPTKHFLSSLAEMFPEY